MADYTSLAPTIPVLKQAGDRIAAQLQAEGAQFGQTPDEIQSAVGTAQGQLANAYSDLASQFGVNPQDAADYATKAVTAAHTVVGAVDSVSNLIKAANSGSPQAIVSAGNAVVGTVVGLATTAGAFTAGTGALIVAGVALAGEAIEALLGGAPAITVCGTDLAAIPNLIVGCAFSPNAQQVRPGSPLWRHFPEPSINPDWFAPPKQYGAGSFIRYVATGTLGASAWETVEGASPGRLVDFAFSHYADLAKDNGAQTTISNFRRAHLAAWKTNNAYSLNGGWAPPPNGTQALIAQPDYLVFLQTVRAWNLAHYDDGSGFYLPMLASGNPFSDALVQTVTAEAAGVSSYELAMVTACISLMGGSPGSDLWQRGTAIYIHAGPAYSPPRVAGIPIIGASSSISTTSKVLLGTVIIGGLGTALYAHATGQTFGGVFRSAWRGLKRL